MKDYYELIKQGKLKTEEEFLEAIREEPMILGLVPEDVLTEQMCYEAVDRDSRALNLVPEKFMSTNLFELAICRMSWL